ncbi:MAG TPA: efflux RND transporter periplasmic adaptor subunit [Bdellovibrionota bacterium]|nr:efflux RND transporter periplasmic adaptor subunit [Bdellovibrionota bacterium]
MKICLALAPLLLLSVSAFAGEKVIGLLMGKQEVTIRSKAQGEVTKIAVREGDAVKEGDSLAVLDGRQKQLEVDIARVELDNAKNAFFRAKKLGDVLSEEELEQKKAAYLTKKTQLEIKQVALENTQITSTISGVVARKYFDKGDSIAIGDKVFDIVQMDELLLKLFVPATGAENLKVGSELGFKTEFHQNRIFKGTVTQISPVIDAVSGTVRVRVAVPNPKTPTGTFELKPGMLVTLEPLSAAAQGQ